MQIVIPRFRVGWILMTPEALMALVESQEDPKAFVYRHIQGDWGDVGPEAWARNEFAATHGEQVVSTYHTRHGRELSLVTEGNRYATTILTSEPEPFERKEIA